MGVLTYEVPASYYATLTTLYITRSDGDTLFVIPSFGSVPNPITLGSGDLIHAQYRMWDDRKHGWGAEQTAEYTVVSDEDVAVIVTDDGAIQAAEPSSPPAGDTPAATCTLMVISYPRGAQINVE